MTEEVETGADTEGLPNRFILEGDPPLDVFQFDPRLVDGWLAIPPTDPINVQMPRVMFDMLFDGIHRSLLAQVDILSALQHLGTGHNYDVKSFNTEVLPSIVAGLNSIRRFQMVLMTEATGLELDANLKVVDGGAKDGD